MNHVISLNVIRTMMISCLLSSCVFPSIKSPVPVYIFDFDKNYFVKGTKNFDIQSTSVGAWNQAPILVDDINGTYICTDLKTYLTKIKPHLKEAASALEDF